MAYAATNTSSVTSLNQIARGFIAGFASTLMFHQGMLMLLYSAGLTPNMPFDLQPTQPLGVPEVYSLALWGGVWGIVFLWVVGHLPQGRLYWIDSVIFGAVAPSLVAWFVVMPLKGMPMGGGWHAAGIATALLINGAWGLGTGLFLRLGHERFAPQDRVQRDCGPGSRCPRFMKLPSRVQHQIERALNGALSVCRQLE